MVGGDVSTAMTAAVELLMGFSLVWTHYHQPTHSRMAVYFTLIFLETVACHVTRDKWNPEFEKEREEIEEGREGGKVGEHVREERGVAYWIDLEEQRGLTWNDAHVVAITIE
jgi:hypothetical protein